jgi:hypothetical protein
MNLVYISRIVFFVIFLSAQLNAQFSDDFSAPELQAWTGDTADFIVTAEEELQLSAEMAGSSFIYTNAQIPDSAVWELYFRLEFGPSGSNSLQWVLQSNTSDRSALNGYGLQIGESGSDDALEFIRWDAGNATVLGRMSEGMAGAEPVIIRAKVKRSRDQFEILASYDGSSAYTDTLIVNDDTYMEGPALTSGLICNYTSTRVDKFFFDDYLIQRQSPDKQPPELIDFSIDSNQLVLDFNEIVRIDNATFDVQPGNFQVNTERINNGASVKLSIQSQFSSLTDYTLFVRNIEDVNGNVASLIEVPFQYIAARSARPFDIVINELMAAPNDVTSLPNVEYIELYNRSNDYIRLGELFIMDESKANSLPDFKFAPDSFIILCNIDDTSSLAAYGTVIGVEGFIGLNNAGDFVQLRDLNSNFIHGVDYTDNWYKDTDKDDGGFSLELIHPDLACSQEAAYRGSDNILGGSPGQQNSVFGPSHSDPLQIDQTNLVDNSQIKMAFNQWLAVESNSINDHISSEAGLNIESIDVRMDEPDVLDLLLSEELEEGKLYTIELESGFENCLGQPIDTTLQQTLGVPAVPSRNDLLISEVVFDPNSGESQWVEIHNPSGQVFEFRYLVLKVTDEEGEDQTTIGLENQILPGDYFVLAENASQVANSYQAPFPNQVLEVDLPSLNRDMGGLELWYIFGAEAKILDSVCYSENWHSGFLRDEKGVSLERLRLDLPACTANNWQSAAEASAFGTPTGENSQRVQPTDSSQQEKPFRLIRPTFSPDGDGFEDVAVIQYIQTDNGQAPPQLDMEIYTPGGHLINPVYSNYSLASDSQLIWDGRMTNGNLAPEGFYIIQAKTYNKNGDQQKWQSSIYLVYPN